MPKAVEAIELLQTVFGCTVVVTNQQGIGKGLMTEKDLHDIHFHMLKQLMKAGATIHGVFYCAELAEDNPPCRKPNAGMALQAKDAFPEIDFQKSLMVGDSLSDMQFAENLGMVSAFIGSDERYNSFPSLFHLAEVITSKTR